MECIIFDLFGTLITAESDDNAHRALSKELAHIHGYVFSWEEHFELYYELVHRGREEKFTSNQAVWKALLILSDKHGFKPKIDYDEIRRLHLMFHIDYAEPYQDAKEALSLAKKLCGKVGLVTDADTEMALGILRRLGLLEYLDVVVTSEEYGVNKPDPKLFLIAAEKLGVNPTRCVMIGDSWKDVEGAKKAGMKAIFLKRRDIELTINPDAEAHSLVEAVKKAVELVGCKG